MAVVTLALPGFGPVVAGGLFTLLALGAVGGAMAGGMIGSLTGIGVPEHHAQAIEQAMVAGCSVVSVHTTERHQEAAAILDRNGAHRMDADIDLPTVADT